MGGRRDKGRWRRQMGGLVLVLVLWKCPETPLGQAPGPHIRLPASPCPYTIPSKQKNEPHPIQAYPLLAPPKYGILFLRPDRATPHRNGYGRDARLPSKKPCHNRHNRHNCHNRHNLQGSLSSVASPESEKFPVTTVTTVTSSEVEKFPVTTVTTVTSFEVAKFLVTTVTTLKVHCPESQVPKSKNSCHNRHNCHNEPHPIGIGCDPDYCKRKPACEAGVGTGGRGVVVGVYILATGRGQARGPHTYTCMRGVAWGFTQKAVSHRLI